ncbi:MAG: protein TolQ [Sulfuricellaceae bacterium]|nr:protein TolQ [Sulfuricellaceae bacterium]
MNVTQDLSFIGLISNASIVVQLVMLGLLLASMASWWYIFRKMFTINDARQASEQFERDFWGGFDLNTLFQKISSREVSGMESIFEGGFKEFLKQRKQTGTDVGIVMESTRRAMRASYHRELDNLESHLPFLATVGSVSPYVGLFGTVWGIMNAFRGLSSVGQATLAQVAPGIAEALIATAMGLFAAIPAVIAYNRYSAEIDRLATRFESFMEEFSNILQRQVK